MCSMNSHTFYRQNIGTASYFYLWPVLFLIFDCRYSRYPTYLCDFSRNPIRRCYFFLDIKPTFDICSPISNLPLRFFPISNSPILFFSISSLHLRFILRYLTYLCDVSRYTIHRYYFLDIKPTLEICSPISNLPLRFSPISKWPILFFSISNLHLRLFSRNPTYLWESPIKFIRILS